MKNNKIHIWAPEIYSLKGGIQVFSMQLVRALVENYGHDCVHVLTKNDHEPSHDEIINITVLGQWPKPLRTLAFSVVCLFYAWKESPKLILSTHIHFGPLAWLIKSILGIPFVLVSHGIEVWHLNNKKRKWAMAKADLILSVSNYTRDHLINMLELNPEKVVIFPNTFDPHKFLLNQEKITLREKYKLPAKTQIILTVCRLAQAERYKGYDQIIKALPKIASKCPEIKYIIAGKGPDKHRLEQLIIKHSVQDYVMLVGFIPDEQLTDYYSLSDVFAMPSKAEGFGIVYLEALSCGKPVLAGNRDGSRDAVADGEMGVLIDPDNIDEIADNLIQILQGTHPHPLIYQPEELRKRVIEKFGFERFQKRVNEYLAPFLNE